MIHGAMNRRGLLVLGAIALAPRAFAQTPSRIPMQVIKGKIFIDVTVAGRAVQAMVDSGAAYSGLHTDFAQAIGIQPKGRKVALRHVQGNSSGRWAEGVALNVGGVVAKRAMLVTDFSLLTASVLHPILVLIGADFLAGYVAEFDFDAGVLTLHARQGFAPPALAVLTPLAPPNGMTGGGTPMTAPVLAEGATLQALVDTGSQAPLIVSPSVARRLKLLKARTVSTSPIGGIGGTTPGKITSLKTFSVGGVTVSDMPVQVTARELANVEANLGLEVLSRFRLWLDLGGGRLWLAPRAAQPPFAKNLLGFFGLADGEAAIRVTFVAKGSPADAAGVRAGDIIERINGKAANTAQLALADAPAGTALTLALQGGETRLLTLAPYY